MSHCCLIAKIRRAILLLLEQLSGLCIILFSFVAHLIVDFYFIFCHLDVVLNDTDFFLFFWSVEAEVSGVVSAFVKLTLCSSDWLR